MTIHYSVESLSSLFLSDKFLLDKNEYKLKEKLTLSSLETFLNSIEINKQYFRTGIQVKNPRYKRKVYDDTGVIKQLKLSLNKMSGLTHEKLSQDICIQLNTKRHLYPILLQYTLEQSLSHHNYCSYYARLVELLHLKFKNTDLLNKQIDDVYQTIIKKNNVSESAYSELCSKNKQTDQLIGYSIFISELEIKEVITNKIGPLIQLLLETLKSSNEDECYKCVVCIYNIFKVLYKNKPILKEYEDILNDIKSTMKFMKVKFKIMDILENR